MEALAILLATLYASLTGLSIVIDRVILTDIIDHHATFLITSTVSTFLLAVVGLSIMPMTFTLPLWLAGLFVLLGLFKTLPIYLYFRAIEVGDASTVAPIISMQPALTVLLAFVFLGERLHALEYGAASLIIVGAFLLTVTGLRESFFALESVKSLYVFNWPAVVAAALALLWSVEAILIKYALSFVSYWTVFFWSSLVAVGVALMFLVDKEVTTELRQVLTGTETGKRGALAVSEFISSIAGATMVAAYAFGPVSEVAPVMHTYAVFVFVYVLILHWVDFEIDMRLSRYALAKKAIAVVFALTGILLLAIIP